ncbi:Gfo/Idh/MocA family protein [Phenylobacterium deserti]|uniref:Gfo/Idh/MocA family oxidoreductase n=1 Tax=Phenylobacterium deserti TaxID=1914756 RepID=A0A328APF6_9CAUL|nr:Gfo/Idh/MocA family oxidoreductase [Phenylobacterium deserti]RAK56883.1 gfo/Idh/MocA family oxidoreductase [Phenylobacterium deserti]
MDDVSRRNLLLATGVGAAALVGAVHVQAQPTQAKPTHKIRFGVIGLDHYHIMSMTQAVQRGGGELVAFYATDPKHIADFRQRFGDIKLARSEDEILEDRSIQLIAGAPVPHLRAPLGIKAMRNGKDFLGDKPAVISLEQLTDVRKAVKETGRKFAIMYSERLEVPAAVKAGELVQAGAIGKVVQTVNLAPHQVRNTTRPDWFWDPAKYGGILTDIGSHQADQFLFYTGSKTAKVVASQVGNVSHKDRPQFQDFGDMTATGDGGTGYIRVDWYTPDGLGVWGDGRLFILGTEGYIELRKYVDVAGRKGGNHLILVDRKQTTYMDCSQVALPFGPQFVADIVNRTSVAQDQEQALLAAELVLTAQKNASRLTITA